MPDPIILKSKTITGTSDGPHLLITAGVHGDEFEPMAAVRALIPRLRPEGLRGRVTHAPVVNEAVIGRARELGLLTLPGCYSPTEMMRAHKAGADLVKLFPGPADGPGFVRACLGPMPFLKIFPTGGVTLENARAHLDAGAFGVGFVTPLFEPDDLQAGRFDAVRARAEQMVAAVAGA